MVRKSLNIGIATLTAIAAILISLSVLFSAGNAFSRYLLSVSSTFVEEFCCIIVVIMMYLMQPRLEFMDEQLSISVLDEKLEKFPMLRKILFWIRGAVTLFLYIILIRAGFRVVNRQIELGSATPVMHLPYSVMYGVVLATLILVIIYWAFHFFVKDRRKDL